MGKILINTDYKGTKPKDMPLFEFVEESLINNFDNLRYNYDEDVYCDSTFIDLEEFKTGFWIFKQTYQRWKYKKMFRVFKKYGDVHIISYTPEINQELIHRLFGEVVKTSEGNIILSIEDTEYVSMNNKPNYPNYDAH